MDITKHAFERYVERIIGIKDRFAMKQYLEKNRKQITEHIIKLKDYSRLIYTGQIGGDKTTKDFYVHQDIVMVTNKQQNTIITIFKLNFPYPEDAKNCVIQSLIREIEKLDLEIEEAREVNKINLEINDYEREKIKCEIITLEEKIKLLKTKDGILELERKEMLEEVVSMNKQRDQFAQHLLGKSEYKEDLKIKNKK